MIAEFHPQAALNHQKHFVFVVVMMPDKFALEAHCLHVAIVDLSQDLGAPKLVNLRKFPGDVDRVHACGRMRRQGVPG